MPRDFQFAATPDLWVLLKPPTGPTNLAIVGRLRRGVTQLAAREDIDHVMAVVAYIRIPVVKSSRPGQLLVPLRQQVVGDVQPMLVSLLAAVLLVLVIACGNAQLVLAQLHARRRNLAIRAALGSSPQRLACEVLADRAAARLWRCGGHRRGDRGG